MAKTKKIPQIIKDVKACKPRVINWETDKIISHTQMSIFNQCNYRWGLTYRDKIKLPNPSIHMIFGTSLHLAIQSYLEVYYNQSVAAANRLDIEMSFRQSLKSLYLEDYNKNNKIHFSTPEELDEFCLDGIEILRYFRRKITKYFSKKGWYIIGCEVPIVHNILPNVYYNGSLDVVLYHEPTNKVLIIDLKSSTKSWGDKAKKDETKLSQLILYKKLFSQQYNFPIENIDIEFLILKRKINEEADFPEHRIQRFIPASGKGKISKAYELLENFANSTFDNHGNIRKDMFKKNISPTSCKFCLFAKRDDLCPRGTPFKKVVNPFQIF